MITEAEQADALARYQAQLDALPPADEETNSRIAAKMNAIRLRMARDRARAPAELPELGGYAHDHPDVMSEDVGAGSEQDRRCAGRQ